ncbi:MAG TPA: hypothetical protein VH253_14895 [Phycisphaerae bacterium]|nr:hypothetical protein [Phycisphaerae bacterium]
MNRVPTSVKVLSIIGLVFGALGILGTCFNALMLFTSVIPAPGYDELKSDQIYFVVTIIGSVIGLFIVVLLIASSIGSLRLMPCARIGMITYAILAALQTLIFTAFNVLYVVPKINATMPPGSAAGGMAGGIAGGACALLFNFGWAGCILFFFTRPNVINAFRGIFPADPTAFPVLDASQPPADPFP